MAIIKCKMCGGDLNIVEGSSVAECEYCGTKQTVPSADSEKKLTLFGRAGRLLRACEFDKAAGVFEGIVADFPEEAEAYWGLVLCKYGIEYVDDPATGKKIPTCHRSSFDSVLDDENFEQACENADSVARKLYREEAKAIEELRKRIIEVSGKEAPYDIFICYKETDENGSRTLDSVLAQDIYDALTEKGYRVFFSRVTLEDKLGQEYEPYIFAALNSAKVMLAVGTDYDYFNAVWVKNEWSRFLHLIASGQKKTLIPCYKNLDAYDMPKEFAKLQAQDLGKVGAMQDLLRGVDKLMGKRQQPAPAQTIVQQVSSGPSVDSLLKRGEIFLSDSDWEKADEYFDKVLDIDPENAHAYFGKLLALRKVKNVEMLIEQSQLRESDPLFQKAMRYANDEYNVKLKGIIAPIQEAIRAKFGHIAAAQKLISAGYYHTVSLKSDGTVMAVGQNFHGECNVSGWTDITAIAAGMWYTAGLKPDGTVVAVGYDENGVRNISGWTDITAIADGMWQTAGLKSDGTVVAVNCNGPRNDVSGWTDIVAIVVGGFTIVGLKSDGTVVAVGDNRNGQCNVTAWTDIIAIAAGWNHTVGLKSDGTVVATSIIEDETVKDCGQCKVEDWRDVVAVTAGPNHTVGLKSDGTVVAVGENGSGQCNVSNWTDIVAVTAGFSFTVGLKSNGTVVAIGSNNDGQCNVSSWKLFNNIETLEEESKEARKAAAERREQERIAAEERHRQEEEARKAAEQQRRKERAEELNREVASLKAELSNLRGLFSGIRRKQIESRLAEIDKELSRLK